MHLLDPGKPVICGGCTIHAVDADHGADEPEAIGVVVETDGVKVYHTGDTAYRHELLGRARDLRPDIVIACINGTYGNLDGTQAARLAADVGAQVAIPCHFWCLVGGSSGSPGCT
jgi:L-ascorbate 6-phosphate lactonase